MVVLFFYIMSYWVKYKNMSYWQSNIKIYYSIKLTLNMIDTVLWVVCGHDWYESMSDMWTWLIRVYEWHVNMIDTGLWRICEHDCYGSMSYMWTWLIRFMSNMLTWLIRVYEWYVNMINTGLWAICEHD